jgi:hypothetical protein
MSADCVVPGGPRDMGRRVVLAMGPSGTVLPTSGPTCRSAAMLLGFPSPDGCSWP